MLQPAGHPLFKAPQSGVLELKHVSQFQDFDTRWLPYYAASSEITEAVGVVH